VLTHRVGFYQTDAMGIMHHANYLHLLEMGRVHWLEEQHRPYREYIELDLHFAVTKVEIQYQRPLRFDEVVRVHVWLDWIRGASLGIGYELRCDGERVAQARTHHAMVDGAGRPVRIPREQRSELVRLVRDETGRG